MILDVATGLPVLPEFQKSASSPYASPLAAYAAWAAAAGLSATGTAIAQQDDGINVIDLLVGVLDGSSDSRVLVSSEGGIGLFRAAATNVSRTGNVGITAASGSGQVSISRFYSTVSAPSLVLCAKVPGLDAAIYDAKYSTDGTVALFYAKWAGYGASTQTPTEAAFRLSAGRVEVVALAASGNTQDSYFQVFRIDQRTTMTTAAGGGALTALLTPGVVAHFVAFPPQLQYASGGSTTATGVPSAEQVGTNAARTFKGTRFGAPRSVGPKTLFGTPGGRDYRLRWEAGSKTTSYADAIASDGAGTVVAVGMANAVVVSHDDGATWAVPTSPPGGSDGWEDVTWTGQLFAAMSGDAFMWSPDGETWTRTATGENTPYPISIVSNGVGLVIGTNQWADFVDNYVYVSSDYGMTFAKVTTTTQIGHYRVHFLNGQFVSAGYGVTATSIDGINWVQSAVNNAGSGIDVAFGNEVYVFVDYDGRCYTSPDAVTWTQRAIPVGTPGFTGPNGVVFGGGLFLATSNSGAMSTSIDGVVWLPAASAAVPLNSYAIAGWTGRAFLSVGGSTFLRGTFIPQATGFSSTTFGAPFAFRNPIASGFSSTNFGLPKLIPSAVGIAPGGVGEPYSYQLCAAASLGEVTTFSNAYWAFDQWPSATGAAASTRFGYVRSMQRKATGRIVRPYGFTSTRTGVPQASWLQQASAEAIRLGSFGTPAFTFGQQATGFATVTFGSVKVTFRSIGFRTLEIGTATVRRGQLAVAVSQTVRFGKPVAVRPDMYPARGLSVSRKFGRPKSFLRFNHPAFGFSGVQLGAPVCLEHHRVAHIPPRALLGKPLLKRTSAC